MVSIDLVHALFPISSAHMNSFYAHRVWISEFRGLPLACSHSSLISVSSRNVLLTVLIVSNVDRGTRAMFY